MAEHSAQADTVSAIHEILGSTKPGFFVEVGAAGASPGHSLEKSAWSGVVIEPQPDLAAFLVSARNAKVFAVACVAPDEAGPPLALRLSSPRASVGEAGVKPVAADFVIMVPSRTLDDVLQEAGAPAYFDLLALDAGGRELDALLGFDFELWKPRLITIADPIVNLQKHRFLKESGYRLIRRSGGCGWYVPAGSAAVVMPGERLALVREYYLTLPLRMARHGLRRLGRRIAATAK